MPLFWSPRTVPVLAELRRLPAAERDRIWKRCRPKILRHWQVWAAAAAGMGCAAAVFVFASRWLAARGVSGVAAGLPAGLLGGVVGGTLFAQVLVRIAVPYLRAEMQGARPPEEPGAGPGA